MGSGYLTSLRVMWGWGDSSVKCFLCKEEELGAGHRKWRADSGPCWQVSLA